MDVPTLASKHLRSAPLSSPKRPFLSRPGVENGSDRQTHDNQSSTRPLLPCCPVIEQTKTVIAIDTADTLEILINPASYYRLTTTTFRARFLLMLGYY